MDGYLLPTLANIGYMSGALKHFFDTIYYPCLAATQQRPYALYVHGNSDTGGAVRAVESIASGLGWRRARPPVTVLGEVQPADREACWELGAYDGRGTGPRDPHRFAERQACRSATKPSGSPGARPTTSAGCSPGRAVAG